MKNPVIVAREDGVVGCLVRRIMILCLSHPLPIIFSALTVCQPSGQETVRSKESMVLQDGLLLAILLVGFSYVFHETQFYITAAIKAITRLSLIH